MGAQALLRPRAVRLHRHHCRLHRRHPRREFILPKMSILPVILSEQRAITFGPFLNEEIEKMYDFVGAKATMLKQYCRQIGSFA